MSGAGGLQQQVVEAIGRYQMLRAGDNVLVAVSGGPDSVGLLHLLRSLAEELEIELAVAHLNHKLRGESADRDEAYVRQLCENWNVACFTATEDIAARADREGISVEEAGRAGRYEFFTALADNHGFDRVALGHTAGDRVESLLINILRGAGLYGLHGIPPRRGIFIRPLIAVSREAVREYCACHNLQPRCDETNLDPSDFLRNKIRLELLPLLAEEYTDKPHQVLLRLAWAAEEELAWTEPIVQQTFAELAQVRTDKVSLNREKLADMPAGLVYRLLRRGLMELRGTAADIGTVHYDELRRLITEGRTGAELYLPGDIWATIGYTNIELTWAEKSPTTAEASQEWSYKLPVPGAVEVAEQGISLRAELLAERPAELGNAGGSLIIVDAQVLELPLQVRDWRPGDVLQPLGMTGHKKLQDLFVDEKLPRSQRSTIPLVVDGAGRIVWIVGLRMAEQFKVTDKTSKFLRLSVRSAS